MWVVIRYSLDLKSVTGISCKSWGVVNHVWYRRGYDFMLPMCRSHKDLFGVQSSYKLTQYWACNSILCHMTLSGLKGLNISLTPFTTITMRFKWKGALTINLLRKMLIVHKLLLRCYSRVNQYQLMTKSHLRDGPEPTVVFALKLLRNMTYLLAWLFLEYSWVLVLVPDWIKRFVNS